MSVPHCSACPWVMGKLNVWQFLVLIFSWTIGTLSLIQFNQFAHHGRRLSSYKINSGSWAWSHWRPLTAHILLNNVNVNFEIWGSSGSYRHLIMGRSCQSSLKGPVDCDCMSSSRCTCKSYLVNRIIMLSVVPVKLYCL